MAACAAALVVVIVVVFTLRYLRSRKANASKRGISEVCVVEREGGEGGAWGRRGGWMCCAARKNFRGGGEDLTVIGWGSGCVAQEC